MRLLLVAAAFAAASTAAASTAAMADAPRASCIDPQRSYVARPLNHHDVFVQTSMGKPKPPVRLKTSCINLAPAIGIALSSSFACVGLGDTVVATTVDGRREACRVTRVLPYAPEGGDIKR
jgi:hypothetical protein